MAALATRSGHPAAREPAQISIWPRYPSVRRPALPAADRPTNQPEAPVDFSRAPAARKCRNPPRTTNILVLGDSMADWLAYGLEDALSDTPEIGIIRKHRTVSGLIRYDTRRDASTGRRPRAISSRPKSRISSS